MAVDPDILKQFESAPNLVPEKGTTNPEILRQFNEAPDLQDPLGPPAPRPPLPPPPKPTANDNIIAASLSNAKPDEIAKAKSVGQQLGLPTGIVNLNLPKYMQDAQRAAAISDVNSNPTLKAWMEEHPNNAKIALDDTAALNRALVALDGFGHKLWEYTPSKTADALIKGFAESAREGFDDKRVDAGYADIDKLGQDYGLWDRTKGTGWLNHEVLMFAPAMLAVGIKTARAGFYGAFGGLRKAAEDLTEQLGMPESELTGVLSGEFLHPGGFTGIHVPHTETIMPGMEHLSPAKMRVQQMIEPFRQAREMEKEKPLVETPVKGPSIPNKATAEPYVPPLNRVAEVALEHGEAPPVGHDYLSDQIHIEQAVQDADSFQKAWSAAQEPKLRELSPEDLANIFQRKLGDQSIYIPAETVKKLYESTDPHPKDGILGWADNVQQKVAASQALGTDMVVPLSQVLAHADEGLVGKIKDQIRFREVGPNVEEAKILGDREPESYPIHTEASRDAVMELHEANPELFPSTGQAMRRRVTRRSRSGTPIEEVPMTEEGTQRILEAISKRADELREKQESVDAGLDPEKNEYLTGEEQPGQETKPSEELTTEPVRTEEEAPTDISAAARIPHLPEVPHVPEVAKPPEVTRPPEAAPVVEAPKPVEAPPAEAPKAPPIPTTFDNLGPVTIRELVKDAEESTKGQPSPKIDVNVDTRTRTITVHDNGVGHSPDELTHMLESGDLNKVLYLHHNTGLVVYSLHDGEFSVVKTDGRGVRNAYKTGQRLEPEVREQLPQDLEMFPDGHGTRVEVDIPTEYLHPRDNQLRPIELGEAPTAEPTLVAEPNLPPPIPPADTPLTRAVKRERKALYLNPAFKDAKSVGMDQSRFAAYSKKIAVQVREIYEKALEQARKLVARRESPEWAANKEIMKAEVTTDLMSHPSIVADRFIRLGELPTGERVEKQRLDAKAVADMGGQNLDIYTRKKDGVHPDEIAPKLGFNNGKELVEALNNFERQRSDFGKSAREYTKHLIDLETNLRMEEKYGDYNKYVNEQAREMVTTIQHIDLVADEAQFIAERAGLPFDRDTMRQHVEESFKNHVAREISYERFRRAAEQHAKEAERALLKQDFIEAFKAKQAQYLDVLHAKEALSFEKTRARAEKKWRSIASKDKVPTSNVQEYWDNARKILNDIGFKKIKDLQEPTKDLATLEAESSGQAAIAPWLVNLPQGLDYRKLPVRGWEALNDSIDSILHAGREAKKLDNIHGSATMDNFLNGVEKMFLRFGVKVSDRTGTISQQVAWRVRQALASHTLVERMLDYSDKFDPHGLLTQFLDRPMRDAWQKEVELKEKIMTMARDLEKYTDKSINDLIDNKAIRDPNHFGFVRMTRQNLRHVILWAGSEEGLGKLTKGYGITHDQLFDLIKNNARPEDFHWANGYFKMFEELYKEAAPMVRRYTGIEMDKRQARPWGMKLKDGTIVNNDGGYAPLYYDKTKPGGIVDPSMKGDMFDKSYFPVTTPHSYTMEVTKAVGWLDMNGTLLTNKIQQMIHDIAFREAVRNAQKIITEPRFRQLVNRHWGVEYTAQLDSWLKTIANIHAQDDAYAQGAANVIAHIRLGTVGTLINLSRSVALKHGVSAAAMSVAQRGYSSLSAEFVRLGGPAMYRALKQLWQKPTKFLSPDELETARQFLKDPSSMDFAMNSSAFMRERLRPYADTLRGALERASEAGIMQAGRQAVAFSDQVGRTMVAMSDAGSAFTTWTGAYKEALMRTGDHADAVFEADRVVGRAHGSSFAGDKPGVLQIPNTASGQFWKTITSLYSYWSHAFNNMMQLGWDIKARVLRGAGSEPGANWANIAHRTFLLALVPMIMEEAAMPAMSHGEDEGYLWRGTKAALRFMGGMSPYTRDATNMFLDGYEPSVGMIGLALKEANNLRKDTILWMEGKEGKNWTKHLITMAGMLRVPFASQAVGGLTQGIEKYVRGIETPKWEDDDWTAEQHRSLFTTGNIPKKQWRRR